VYPPRARILQAIGRDALSPTSFIESPPQETSDIRGRRSLSLTREKALYMGKLNAQKSRHQHPYGQLFHQKVKNILKTRDKIHKSKKKNGHAAEPEPFPGKKWISFPKYLYNHCSSGGQLSS
jgi:hypothetical protein